MSEDTRKRNFIREGKETIECSLDEFKRTWEYPCFSRIPVQFNHLGVCAQVTQFEIDIFNKRAKVTVHRVAE